MNIIKAEWVKASERLPEKSEKTIFPARWMGVEENEVASYTEMKLGDNENIKVDGQSFKRGFRLLEKLQWLDETPLSESKTLKEV